MTRKEARETVFGLLFETLFKSDENPEDIFELSSDAREIDEDLYIRKLFFGVVENRDKIDGIIGTHSHGWKTERLTRVSRTVLRIAVYEMMYCEDIPAAVSINEAIELCRTFDDDKARPFVNGVLNAVKDELEKEEPQKEEPQKEEPQKEEPQKEEPQDD